MDRQEFYANGKLMISGEYLVLSGAMALAVPVKYGQSLVCISKKADDFYLTWKTLEKGKEKFYFEFSDTELFPVKSTNKEAGEFIRKILLAAKTLNPGFLNDKNNYEIITEINFDMNWGLGSSSSLISNIGWWSGTDPYRLLHEINGGSGYDIACARSKQPILYRFKGEKNIPEIAQADFFPSFSSGLWFVYSGKKQSSAESIRDFSPENVPKKWVEEISGLSREMAKTSSLGDFCKMMEQHEAITGKALGRQPIGEKLFRDFPGSVKSLGAWGGDFFMAAAGTKPKELKNYFNQKGYYTIIPFEEMVLKS